ncbi:IclR family transcriptional regulator [Caproiciproducens sp. R2]|uniref:IclR family transcriptional regulator n=1 Tax=Caproiciproducens sp. R2 TaxID=3435187 RepID=UPI0040346DCD
MYRGNKPEGNGRYAITSVQNALKVLKLFDAQNVQLSLIEISKLSGISKSTTLRIVFTLVQEGFLKQDETSKKYELGIEIVRMGLSAFDSLDLNRIASARLKKLADETGLIVQMAILNKNELILTLKILPKVGFSRALSSHIGGSMPIWCTGIGRLFLANMKEEKAREILNSCELKQYTPNTILDRDEIMRLVKTAAKEKSIITSSEHENGIISICYPIYDHTNKMIAGFSASGIREVILDTDINRIKDAAKKASEDISNELGYHLQ